MKPDVANEFQEVYQEIDTLKERVEKLEVTKYYIRPDIHIGGDILDWPVTIPHSEGHPIPDYDKETDAMLGIEAMEEADEEVDALYENLFMNAAMEYVCHYLKFKPDMPRGEKELRAWGHQNYLLHTALVEAYEAL